MTSRRLLIRALPYLLAPAWSLAACGHTDHSGGTATAAGQVGTDGGAATGGAGSNLPPMAGTTGRGGTRTLPDGGAGGAGPGIMIPGISDVPKTIMCGGDSCSSVTTLAPGVYVDPCCVGDACGVSTQLLGALGAQSQDVCQAKGQLGEPDPSCPDSPSQMLPVMGTSFLVPGFAGCCRAETGTCGVVVDKITIGGLPLPFASPQLGCVDSAPFFANEPGAACGVGTGGAGGAGGAASAGAGGVGASGAGDGGAVISLGGAG
jgi:hypothetical protein